MVTVSELNYIRLLMRLKYLLKRQSGWWSQQIPVKHQKMMIMITPTQQCVMFNYQNPNQTFLHIGYTSKDSEHTRFNTSAYIPVLQILTISLAHS